MLVGLLVGGITGYVVLQGEVSILKTEVVELKEANKAYTNLPKDVKDLTIAHAKTAKTVEAIYLGLVAKGIIKPPQ